jgi:hypothetical protein
MLPIPVIVASYEQVRLDIDQIGDATHFDIVVLDEAQRIKNAESDTAFACRKLPFGRAWALTGTPVENSVSDLLSIYRFLSAGKAGDFRAIRRTGRKRDGPASLAQRASPPSRSARRAERFSRHNHNHTFVRSRLWRPSK